MHNETGMGRGICDTWFDSDRSNTDCNIDMRLPFITSGYRP